MSHLLSFFTLVDFVIFLAPLYFASLRYIILHLVGSRQAPAGRILDDDDRGLVRREYVLTLSCV